MEVTPLTKRAFRSTRGLTGGLAFLLMGALVTVGLSACGAPAYTYVADSAGKTYYKVPSSGTRSPRRTWTRPSGGAGGVRSGRRIWSTAFDAGAAPSAEQLPRSEHSPSLSCSPRSERSPTASNELSYNMLRDFMFPVTSDARQQDAASGFPLTDFKQLRDQTITASRACTGCGRRSSTPSRRGRRHLRRGRADQRRSDRSSTSSWCTARTLVTRRTRTTSIPS